MFLKKVYHALFVAALATGVMSCTTAMPPSEPDAADAQRSMQSDLQSIYGKLAETGGKVFALDPQKSTIGIYVFRSGSAAKLGHNHVFRAPQFSGFVHFPANSAADAQFDLAFRLDQLQIDNTPDRATLGKAFAGVLPPEEIAGLREHMLGDNNLQANRFPFVRIHSLQISGEAPKFAARIQVEMHGQTREIWVPLTVEGLPNSVSVSGSFILRQTDFGVQPFSAIGGLLSVQDEVIIEFQLAGA
jgi:hypothetical protein